MTNKFRRSSVAFLIGLLFAASLSMANAASSSSPWLYYSCYSKNYCNISTIVVSPSGASAISQANCTSGKVPPGYIGVCPRLYNGNDQLCQSVDWQYNSTTTKVKQVSTGEHTVGGQSYYSFGMTRAYNGSGYKTYYTYKSPSLNF